MKYRLLKIFIVTVFIVSALSKEIFPQEIKEVVRDIITNTFNKDVQYDYEKYIIPDSLKMKVEYIAQQKFFGESVYILKIFNEEILNGVALLDNVYGKEMPITFLVIFDDSGKIILADIVKYREPYGGAVQNKNWTAQFKKKDSNSGYKVGTDIDGITGATISVKSITKGIYKISLLYKEIKDSLWNSSYTDLINR
ncbi:MAG: FMN-binding protein [Ignavibacteriaceae bacterium]|jgi:Na+-translocating ferredoxin:NAD+ oxidoreductase RnfG subunit